MLIRVPFRFHEVGTEKVFLQRVDHFNSRSTSTFEQRYYVNLNYTVKNQSTNTILVYIGGEATLESRSVEGGSVIELANRTKAVILGLEHRFFGQSQPFNTLTSDNLKFLTIEQALADLAYFIDEMQAVYCSPSSLCSVAVVGGSYPGSLSSWFRLLYPHMAIASWASSAPILIKANYSEYDDHMATQIAKVSQKCLQSTQQIYNEINEIVGHNASQTQELKGMIGIKPTDNVTDLSFLYMIADIFADTVQYSRSYPLLLSYCDEITQAATYNQRLSVLMNTLNIIINKSGDPITNYDPYFAKDISAHGEATNTRSWTWMTCNQVGWFQTSSGRLRSPRVNIDYFRTLCQDLFHSDSPADSTINMRFGGKDPRSTNVFFLNGDVDPWSRLSIQYPEASLDRNVAVIKNGQHCSDLHSKTESDSESLLESREFVISTMEKWIKFSKSNPCGAHGYLVLNSCKCDDRHTGTYCDQEVHTQSSFQIVTILSVIVPTILLLIIGGSVWICGKREDSDFGSRPALYT